MLNLLMSKITVGADPEFFALNSKGKVIPCVWLLKGTKDNPDWQTLRTNWYNVTAWEDVARDILTSGLDKGDIISFNGTHELKKVQRGTEKATYMGEYTIKEYNVVKKKEHKAE